MAAGKSMTRFYAAMAVVAALGVGLIAWSATRRSAPPLSLETVGALATGPRGVVIGSDSAPIEIMDGAKKYDVDGYVPDFENVSGSIDIQLDGYDRIPFSGSTAPLETQVRNFNAATGEEIVDFSTNGRSMAVRLSSSVINTAMRLGVAKLEVNPRGSRR